MTGAEIHLQPGSIRGYPKNRTARGVTYDNNLAVRPYLSARDAKNKALLKEKIMRPHAVTSELRESDKVRH